MGAVLGVALAVYLGIAGTMYLFQERLLFLPDVPGRDIRAEPGDLGLRSERLAIPTEDGETLDGWFIPAEGADRTLLHFHGNAGNIGDRVDLAEGFVALGMNVVLFDYRGYGRSTGQPDEHGTYRDAEAAWRHLVEGRGIAPHRIVLHGQSLGGAIATWLAARQRPAALAVESSFTSVPELGQELYPWLPVRWLSRIRYDSRAAIRQVRCPVLVIHSRDDEIIPFHHGQELFEAAPATKAFVELRGDHNGAAWISRETYFRGWRDFLSRIPPAR